MMKSRLVWILILITSMWAALIGRAAFLQILPNERLEALRKRQFETTVTLQSRRGDILDRNGQELAISTSSFSVFADPKLVEDPHRTAKILAQELGVSYASLLPKLKQKRRRFVWLQRFIERDARELIKRHRLRGIGFVEESKRTYPNEQLLAPVLGFVGAEGHGLEGVEAQYEKNLAANKREVLIQRDARGRPLILGEQVFNDTPDGADLQLTIDRQIQFVLEQELKFAVDKHQADSAVGVVLDAQTSEILAMANVPSFDLNRSQNFPPALRRNRSVTDAYEPGSTMKTFVLAAALSRGLLEPNKKYDCEEGQIYVDGRKIREADSKHKFGIMTATEILAQSSNVGTSKIAFELRADALRAALAQFGFGEKSGVDLPGEARGILHQLPWRDHLLANISFGHGVTATPLQVANAYAAIANGGWLKRPFLVRRVHDHSSGRIDEFGAKTVRRVLTAEAASKLRLMLAAATGPDATGAQARVVGFPVAGKTGTAQKVNPNGRGYLPNAYISSFAGFLPVNDPRFVIYIAVDHPRQGYYGSQVAAPVFSRVASFAVRRSGLAPVLISEQDLVPKRSAEKTEIVENQSAEKTGQVPNLLGLTLREALQRVGGSGLQIQTRGQGVVRSMYPPHGAEISSVKRLILHLEPQSVEE